MLTMSIVHFWIFCPVSSKCKEVKKIDNHVIWTNLRFLGKIIYAFSFDFLNYGKFTY